MGVGFLLGKLEQRERAFDVDLVRADRHEFERVERGQVKDEESTSNSASREFRLVEDGCEELALYLPGEQRIEQAPHIHDGSAARGAEAVDEPVAVLPPRV